MSEKSDSAHIIVSARDGGGGWHTRCPRSASELPERGGSAGGRGGPRRARAARAARARRAPKHKAPSSCWMRGFVGHKSLTMTYFHRRTSTIIGAKAFHGPVRDGKEWVHFAMVVKRNLSRRSRLAKSLLLCDLARRQFGISTLGLRSSRRAKPVMHVVCVCVGEVRDVLASFGTEPQPPGL